MQSYGFQKKKIQPKESLGARLAKRRKDRKLSLTTAEHDTKIRARYLTAIEENRLSDIPDAHCKGFVRQYAAYLGLDESSVESDLDYLVSHARPAELFSPRKLGKETKWIVTPRVVGLILSVLVLMAFIGYVTYQVQQFAAPPVLQIIKPTDQSVVATESLTIEGKTEPGVDLYIDNLQASVKTDGAFSYPITLRPGLNQITVRAENHIKKQATRVVSILYQQSKSTAINQVSPNTP